MKTSAFKSGDFLFAAMFAVLGLVWIVGSLDLPFWAGFAPDSGFLPLVYGVLLFGLSTVIAIVALIDPVATSEREPLRKSMLLLVTLVVSVGAISFLGFVAPLFGMMMFMYAYVERLPLLRSFLASAGTTGVLALIFEHWLDVPLPLSPWGF
jgi:putative tricarboxylic transport membrane protein